MEVGNYLKKYQPIAYKVFSNAIEKNHISHAYMLVGESGIPLKEIALFLAKSLLCDDPQPLACEKCMTCIRIEEGFYSDVRVFDGSAGTIKKGDVENVTGSFSKTAYEEKGKMIYILHLVENMTVEAVNAILKFLEEPGRDIYAILTTENEAKVLPTILSRAQGVRFKLVNKKIIIKESLDLGVPQEDAELLANFYNDSTIVREQYKDKNYITLKDLLLELLSNLVESKAKAIYFMESKVLPVLKNKEIARTFLDMLTVAFQDITNKKIGKDITLQSYDTIITQLADILPHLDKSLVKIMTARTSLELNLNIPLMMDKLFIEITED